MGHPTLQVVFLSEGVVEMQLSCQDRNFGILKVTPWICCNF